MKNSSLRLQDSATATGPSMKDLEKYAEGWFLSGEISRHRAATLANRRLIVKNLKWFLHRRQYETCDVMEL